MKSDTPESRLLYVYSRNVEVRLVQLDTTHTELANELGLSVNTVNRLKSHAARFIDPGTLAALVKHFKCTPNDLLTEQPGTNYTFKW